MPSAFDADFENAFAPDLLAVEGESVTFFPVNDVQRRGSRPITAVVNRIQKTRDRGRTHNTRQQVAQVTATDDSSTGFTEAELQVGSSVRLAEDGQRERWAFTRTVSRGGGLITAEFTKAKLEDAGRVTPADL